MRFSNKKLKFKAGFSLIEILAVLFVVSVSLLGVVSLIVQNIQVQSINKNNLVASSLAQEGIELIRKKRDSNWRSQINFDSGLTSEDPYIVDFYNIEPETISDSAAAKLYINENGYYSHNNLGSSTPFSRAIYIRKLESYEGEPLEVRSLVSWEGQNRSYNYELRTLLFNWR